MAHFIDEHDLHSDETLEAIAAAHQRDLAAGANHGVRFERYWVDQARGKVFCLVEAPSAEAVAAAHSEANGAPGDRIAEVIEGR